MYSHKEITDLVSMISGKVSTVVICDETDDDQGYRMQINDDGTILVYVPHNSLWVEDEITSGIVHEALHGKHTQMVLPADGRKIFEKCAKKSGLNKFSVAHAYSHLHNFINAIEDIRIELKAQKEYEGGYDVLHGSHISSINKRFGQRKNQNYTVYTHNVDDSLKASHEFLCLNISLFTANLPYYSQKSFRESTEILPLAKGNLKDAMRTKYSDYWKVKFLSDYNKSLGTNLTTPRAIKDFGRRLCATKTTEEGIILGSRYLLEYYLGLLPYNTRDKLSQKTVEQALKEITQGMKDGTVKTGIPGQKKGVPVRLTSDKPSETKAKGVKERKHYFFTDRSEIGFNLGDLSYVDASEYKGMGLKHPAMTAHMMSKAVKLKKGLAPLLEDIKSESEGTGVVSNREKGVLDNTLAHKLFTEDDKIFKSKVESSFNEDVAFSVLIDTSGSMGYRSSSNSGQSLDGFAADSRLSHAVAVSAAVTLAIEDIGRTASLIDFNSNSYVSKEQNNTLTPKDIDSILTRSGGGTYLLDGLNKMRKELSQRVEGTKVSIVITDGEYQPSGFRALEDYKNEGLSHLFVVFIGTRGHNRSLDNAVSTGFTVSHAFATDGDTIIKPIIQLTKDILTKKI